MLGPACLRRLQTPRPYVCLQCLRSPRTPPRALGALRAARYHSSPLLRSDAESAPSKQPDPSPPSETAKPKAKGTKKKRKQRAQAPATRKTVHGELKARKLTTGDRAAVSEPQNSEDGNGSDAPQPENGSLPILPKKKLNKLNKLKRRQEKAANKSAKKAMQGKRPAPEDAKGGGDIGDVLQKASEGAAEVLAAAAKSPTEPKRSKGGSASDKAETLEQALRRLKNQKAKRRPKREFVNSVSARDAQLTPIDVEQPPIPQLSYGLDRVLFNPGVYHLQDPRSEVYNFDPYLEKIMPVEDFNFDSLKRYITSSQDETLSDLARNLDKRYVGSTSSMTAVLAHFHFLLSNWRQLNLKMLSKGFQEHLATFTKINRLPAAIFLRWKNGTYAIDADKQYDTANVLSMLGRSMEKLLTLPTDEYERYRRGHPNQISEKERELPESYHYTTQGDMLMRSQLDAQDSRLPGTGMFDLKTRAVVSIRMDVQDWQENTGYQIKTGTGKYESFEREYYDMMRSTMLKYSLQARMGRMDGIFVAYHNIERIFGFQYVSLEEMDAALHNPESGTRRLGDQEFRLSVDLFNKVLNMATEKFPETSIRFHFETREGIEPFMYIFAEPMPEEEVQRIQDTNKAATEAWERKFLDLDTKETSEEAASEPDEQNNAVVRVANRPAIPEHSTVDAVAMPELFEIPDEEPEWTSLSLHNQPAVLEKEILEDSDVLSEDFAMRPITEAPTTSETSGAPEEEPYNGPLLCLKLFTRNKVNGEYVNRVTDVREDTEWAVDYQFEEVTPTDAYRRYAESKRRRAVLLAEATLREEDQGEAEKVLNYYQQKLRDISMRGREWRDQRDAEQKDKEKVVYRPLGGWIPAKEAKPDALKDMRTNGIDSVDGYMGWLYGEKE